MFKSLLKRVDVTLDYSLVVTLVLTTVIFQAWLSYDISLSSYRDINPDFWITASVILVGGSNGWKATLYNIFSGLLSKNNLGTQHIAWILTIQLFQFAYFHVLRLLPVLPSLEYEENIQNNS